MFFRFVSTVVLITAVSLLGIEIERRNLQLKREISGLHDQLHNLQETRCRLYLKTQELGALPVLEKELGANNQTQLSALPDVGESVALPPLLEWRLGGPRESDQ